jgi:hypothetical protein
MLSHAVVGRSCRCCCLSVPTESGRIARPTTKSNSLRHPFSLRRGRNPTYPLSFLRPYHRMEKKFQIPLHSINTWQTPLLACALKVLGEGAERGEGEPIHCFTKWVFWVLMAIWESRYHSRFLQSWYEQFRVRGICRFCIKDEGLKGSREIKAINMRLF